MLRALVALLLVGNGLLLASLLGAFDGWLASSPGDREPERLRRQIHPEAVQVTPAGPAASASPATASAAEPVGAANPATTTTPTAAGAGAAASPVLAGSAALAGAGATVAAAATAGAVSAAAAGPLACLQAGPFDANQLAQAARVMRAAGFGDGLWQSVPLPPTRQWLIAMGPYADRTQLARKEAELRRRNVDYGTLAPSAELPAGVAPGLALGRHDSEAAADAALDRLVARGVRSARVVELAPVSGRALLRVPAADASQQAALAQLALPAALRWTACPAAPNGAPPPAVNGRR